MNQYHIYEEIGRGKHSVIYKGRKKKTIHYYAIKSVDKSQKPRVLQEVRTMHALDHDNILKFFAWYETSNHLWLILEYCVGGDLRSLLRQDIRLPEASIHDFGRDLVISLQYLHAAAIIYCDLKPSNVLLDENGRIKLGGFGLSRRLADINRTSLQQLPPAKRGTPCYMAPELFQEGATHSTASDLWALGCVLYECAAGHPPFVSSSFNQLVHDILQTPPAPLSGASPPFQDLVTRLLDKDPGTRLKWPEVCNHSFWQTALPSRKMPPEPMLEAYLSAASSRPAAAPATWAPAREDTARAGGAVDVMRLSQIVRSNLEKEGEGADYSAATTCSAPQGDVQLHDPDAELDFEEAMEEGTPGGDEEEYASPLNSSIIDDSAAATPDDANRRVRQGTAGRAGTVAPLVPARPPATEVAMRQPDFCEHPLPSSGGGKQNSGAVHLEVVAGPPPDPPTAGGEAQPSGQAIRPITEDLIWHTSDAAVKPIVANRRIERLPELRWDSSKLPFAPLTMAQVHEMMAGPSSSQGSVEAFLTLVYRALGSPAPLKDKVNVLAYFESVCGDTAAANVVVNSTLTLLLVRMLRNARAPGLRLRLASLLGLLIRHATYITDDLASSGLVEVLTDGLGEKNERVRRRIIACLGELLFYIATQPEGNAPSVWQVSSSTIAAVTRSLEPGQDEITQHYAVKLIENIGSGGGSWPTRFANQAVLDRLFALVLAEGTPNETLRAAAASAVARLVRHSPHLILHLFSNKPFILLLKGFADSSPKIQTATLNILNQALVTPNLALALPQEDRELVAAVACIAESGTGPLKGKALLSLGLLCRCDTRFLLLVCTPKLVGLVEKLGREEAYTADCVAALQSEVESAVALLLHQVADELAAQTGGGGAGRGGQQLEVVAALEPLLTSPLFRPSLVSADLVADVSAFLTSLASARVLQPALEDFKATLMAVLETIVQGSEAGDAHAGALVQHLLPSLAGLLGSGRETQDVRFWALKLLWELTARLLSPPSLPSPNSSGGTGQLRPSSEGMALREEVEAGVEEHVLALLGSLLEEGDPMPLYALKLLGALLEADARRWLPHFRDLDLFPRFFEFLSLEHANNNVHNIQLCQAVVAAGALSPHDLSSMGVASKVAAVLSYAHENSVDLFLEPVLELCAALLDQDAAAMERQEAGSGSTAPLLDQLPLLLEVTGHEEPAVALLAGQCIALLTSSFPEPAAAALLAPEALSCIGERLEDGEGALQHALLTAIPITCRASGSFLPNPDDLEQLRIKTAALLGDESTPEELHAVAVAACDALSALISQLS